MNREVICTNCGSPALIDTTQKTWDCQWCQFTNHVTIMPMDAEWYSDFVANLEQRIAALEAQNARLLALVREVAACDIVMIKEVLEFPIDNKLWQYVKSARALLAELKGGDDG